MIQRRTSSDMHTQAAISLMMQAKPIRSLQEDPILTHRTSQAPTEEDLWKQDLIKQSRREAHDN